MSLGKKWEDVVEEGRDALNFTTEEKNPFEHQKIEFLQERRLGDTFFY